MSLWKLLTAPVATTVRDIDGNDWVKGPNGSWYGALEWTNEIRVRGVLTLWLFFRPLTDVTDE